MKLIAVIVAAATMTLVPISSAQLAIYAPGSPIYVSPPTVHVYLENETSGHLINLFLEPVGEQSFWPEDVLVDDIIDPHDDYLLTIHPDWHGCLFNMQATFTDRAPVAILNINLCASDQQHLIFHG